MNVLTSKDLKAVREIIDVIGAPVTLGDLEPNGQVRIFTMNHAAETFYGVPSTLLEGRLLSETNLKPEGRAELIAKRFHACLDAGEALQFMDFAPVDTVRGRRWVHTMMSPLLDADKKIARVMATLSDVTDLKQSEEKLTEALTHVLSGYIPICAACKKIKDDSNNWQGVEGYIEDKSEAHFSHTMCPECMKSWYGDTE